MNMGIPTGPIKKQHKVVSKMPLRRVQFVSPTVQFTLQECFSSLLLSTIVFSVTVPCINFFSVFSSTLPSPRRHFSYGLSLIHSFSVDSVIHLSNKSS